MLFIFGAGVGSIAVAMNTHSVHVQNMAGKHIMSSLYVRAVAAVNRGCLPC